MQMIRIWAAVAPQKFALLLTDTTLVVVIGNSRQHSSITDSGLGTLITLVKMQPYALRALPRRVRDVQERGDKAAQMIHPGAEITAEQLAS